MKKTGPVEDAEGKNYLLHIAYDSVIFGFSGNQLQILLLEYENTGFKALPGGFVEKKENLNDAVKRGLKERTGLDNIFLEQFYTFGDMQRYVPQTLVTILKAAGLKPQKNHWLLHRFISVAYYALINFENVTPMPDRLSDACSWYHVRKLPKLILDHKLIIDKALETLRNNLDRNLAGFNLLAPRFTMKELQHVYEAILGKKLVRANFQRKMLSLGILKRHQKHYSGKAHKAPYLYSFKKR